jgi:hypothetical protein
VLQSFPKLFGPYDAIERLQIFHSSPSHDVREEMDRLGQGFGGWFEPDHARGNREQFGRLREAFHKSFVFEIGTKDHR